ncbi:hypothetical protein [Azospira restricta]|uniref:Uncharacterized protein n=1 Tax=Azospira restricta TaxID=404405 RepID=A0A974PVL1_9RHOO|nr:hypothetical protein [Azospira restricta]QRJ62106.1 hypothetical protein IWH25_09800 [Azospira restricta]
MLFALTGFLLNHRAVLKIPALERQEVRQVLALPEPAASPERLAGQLAGMLALPPAASRSPPRSPGWPAESPESAVAGRAGADHRRRRPASAACRSAHAGNAALRAAGRAPAHAGTAAGWIRASRIGRFASAASDASAMSAYHIQV